MQCPEDKSWHWIDLPKVSDVRGNLSIIESNRDIPFEIARAYYIYDVPSGSTRGATLTRHCASSFLPFQAASAYISKAQRKRRRSF